MAVYRLRTVHGEAASAVFSEQFGEEMMWIFEEAAETHGLSDCSATHGFARAQWVFLEVLEVRSPP